MFGSDKRDDRSSHLLRQRSRVSKALAVCVAAIALFVRVQPAVADLSEDADRLVQDWSTRGAHTQRISPVFAEHGQSRIINVAADPARDVIPGCTTVAILGAPTIDYAVAPLRDGIVLELLPLPDGHPAVSLDAASVRSAFGLATLTRCNEERRELNRLVVSMRSPRGTIEAVIARSTASIGDAREVLSERVAGVVAPRGDPGRPIEPGPLAERVVRAEENARLDGAASVSRVSDVASVQGTGQTRLRLAEGCHRIAVMAAVPSTFPHSATDVDAEARDADGHVLAQDRSETPDAHLEFCIGESARISIMYAGVSGAMPIIVTDAVWHLSASIPNHWGGRVRAGFALALRRRNAPSPTALPVSESLGSSGATMVPVSIEPDHCYFASVAMLRGEPRSIRISANVGDRYIRDDVNDRPEGAGIAFCSGSEQSARIEVDVRGNNVFWVFALFPFGEATP